MSVLDRPDTRPRSGRWSVSRIFEGLLRSFDEALLPLDDDDSTPEFSIAEFSETSFAETSFGGTSFGEMTSATLRPDA